MVTQWSRMAKSNTSVLSNVVRLYEHQATILALLHSSCPASLGQPGTRSTRMNGGHWMREARLLPGYPPISKLGPCHVRIAKLARILSPIQQKKKGSSRICSDATNGQRCMPIIGSSPPSQDQLLQDAGTEEAVWEAAAVQGRNGRGGRSPRLAIPLYVGLFFFFFFFFFFLAFFDVQSSNSIDWLLQRQGWEQQVGMQNTRSASALSPTADAWRRSSRCPETVSAKQKYHSPTPIESSASVTEKDPDGGRGQRK
jgi:hypothetical protein